MRYIISTLVKKSLFLLIFLYGSIIPMKAFATNILIYEAMDLYSERKYQEAFEIYCEFFLTDYKIEAPFEDQCAAFVGQACLEYILFDHDIANFTMKMHLFYRKCFKHAEDNPNTIDYVYEHTPLNDILEMLCSKNWYLKM